MHFFGTTIGHAIGTLTLGLILTWFKSVRDKISFLEVLLNWREIISPITISVLIFLLFALAIKYVKINSQYKANLETLQHLGVKLFSLHSTTEEKREDWEMAKGHLAVSSKESPLWILGATGKETFGSSQAPLCDAIRKYEQPIRVLLLRPYSKGFERRITELNVNSANYEEEILDAIDFCAELKRRHSKDIEIKVYSEIAIWKMILTSKELWLQYYPPTRHVDDSPIYCFEFKGDPLGLYSAFKSVFSKRWMLDQNPMLDLVNWNRAKVDKAYWQSL